MAASQYFGSEQHKQRAFTLGDALALLGLGTVLYIGIRLAFNAPSAVQGPDISLSPRALPWYAALSIGRMAAAYFLSLMFMLVYGRIAAYHRRAEHLMIPFLDVLQSVPILSFLPVVLLSLSAFLADNIAAELASIILIFTSQAWNLTFAWYQSLTTVPKELREASRIFRLNGWMQFKTLELPFASISLVWNSIMSWAGGWFFLMAAETFRVGQLDFRLPGLGSYLQAAAVQENYTAILWGVFTLVLVIVTLDQIIWRPLLAWSNRFKVEMVEEAEPPSSWFYDAWRSARLPAWFGRHVSQPLTERLDGRLLRRFPLQERIGSDASGRRPLGILLLILVAAALLFGAYRAGLMLVTVPLNQWAGIGLGLLATLLRVALALTIALAWTVPIGVAIGTNRRLANFLQPLAQIVASIPATALFPVLLLFILQLPAGLNLAAVLLMLLGTQWYLLFNVIAGASAIPQDLKYTAALLRLGRRGRWRTLIVPALFPYLVTGAITASGGAWNASIVAEYVHYGGQTLKTVGIGATIASATAQGDYPLLLAATLTMVLAVVSINRLLWRRLYLLAEEKYRME